MNVVNEETNNIWQPIETAPRDGTKVILRCKYTGAVASGWFHKSYGYFLSDKRNGEDFTTYFDPSHWMPLPTPPTE